MVNIVANMARNKGDALGAEPDRLKCNWFLCLGDDDNDEGAFALGGNTIPVRIGRRQQSCARYYLRTHVEIDELLRLLVWLRSPPWCLIWRNLQSTVQAHTLWYSCFSLLSAIAS